VKNLEAELREALNDNSRAKRLWRAEVADTTSQAEIELTRTERAHATEVEALRRALAQASHERDDYHGQLMQLRGAHEQLHAMKVSCMHTSWDAIEVMRILCGEVCGSVNAAGSWVGATDFLVAPCLCVGLAH
jgi:hypothetical protein